MNIMDESTGGTPVSLGKGALEEEEAPVPKVETGPMVDGGKSVMVIVVVGAPERE